MQYFSIIARFGDDPPKTCAMLQGANLEAAAIKARRLILSDMLPHVRRNSTYSIRRSSRRETSLLQDFLSNGTGDKMSTYLQEDLDSLLSRRNGMLLSFYMALYLDPGRLKSRFDAKPSGRTTSTSSPSGTGGVTHEPSVMDETTSEAALLSGEAPSTSPQATEEKSVVNDDNQISALEDIVNGSNEQSEAEIDLF